MGAVVGNKRIDAPALAAARETARSRRHARRRSVRVAGASRDERADALRRAQELEQGVERPRTRGDCEHGPRPCPFVACRHHLYLEVSAQTGTIRLNFPALEVWELSESCALDVAERGGHGHDYMGGLLSLTRERVRQIEGEALAKLARKSRVRALHADEALETQSRR